MENWSGSVCANTLAFYHPQTDFEAVNIFFVIFDFEALNLVKILCMFQSHSLYSSITLYYGIARLVIILMSFSIM